MRLWVFLVLLASAVPLWAQQAYPSRPIRLVVPFPAGGFSDLLVRLLVPGLTERLGQPVVVDNRPGASGNIGAEAVARAAPDGYTLLANSGNFASNAALMPALPFDSLRDFAPVTLLAEAPLIVVVHPSLPAKSLGEFVALARERPGGLNYASSGVGTTGHFAAELLKSMARIDLVHIPYKGGGPNMAAVLSGEVAITFPILPAAMPHVRSGKLRALAVSGSRRASSLPDLPTVAELGYPGYEIANWLGIAAPAGTPEPIVRRLHAEFSAAAGLAEARSRFIDQGAEPLATTPAQFQAYLEAQIARLRSIAAGAGIKAE
jgi:tripartite-type tricarboxylate transporter receptor subunit TctC